VGIVFKNNAKTTLASSLSNSATSATVTDGSVFPSLSAGEFFLVTFDDGTNNEICKCTARSGNTLTIVRAQESTTARAFSSGDAAEGRVTAGVLETIQENIAAKSANQTVFNTTTSGGATTYNIGTNPGVEANAMVFLNGVLQHHDTLSFSGTNLTFDAAPANGLALEVIIDNLINLQSSNLTVDSFTAADVSGSPQTDFTLSDTPAAETNLIVFVDGVFQDQDAYTISSNTLTITTGVIAGRGVTVYVINPVNIGTPSDSTVTSAKLSGNITMPGTLTVGANDVAFDSPTFVVDNANSRVGLGTASPSVPVDIVGDVKMSADLTVDTTTLVVDSSNNRVGVGTASPVAELNVDGRIVIDDGARSNPTGGASLVLDYQTTSNLEGRIRSRDWDGAAWKDLTIEANDINLIPDGNVGIGTSSPSTLLHLGGTAPGDSIIRQDSTSSGTNWEIGERSAGKWQIFEDDGDSIVATFMSTGNVGLGTESPSHPLHISSTGHTQYQQHRQSSGVGVGQEMKFAFNTADGTEEVYSSLYTELAANTNGAETGKVALRVADAGSLGYVIKGDGGGDTTLYADGDAVMTLKDGGNVEVPGPGLYVADDIGHLGDSDTYISFESDFYAMYAGGNRALDITSTYAIPKMNFHYANNNIYAVYTTNDELGNGQGVLMLKQQISVSAGSKIIVWYQSGQILNNNQGGNGSVNSNPQICIYVTTNSSAPPTRGSSANIVNNTDHFMYPMGSVGAARVKMNGMGATGTLSTGGTYYIYMYGGAYNSGSFSFNYQDSSSNTRGSSIIWAEIKA